MGVLWGGVRGWIFSSIFVQSWWFKMKSTLQWLMNSFLIPSYMCARHRARQKSMKLKFLWKTSIFDHFHVTYIWSLKWLLSAYNGQFMNEIFIVWNIFMLVLRNVCARSGARDISTKSIYFLWRGFYTIVTKINQSIAKIRIKHMFMQRLIHVKHHSKKYYISKM